MTNANDRQPSARRIAALAYPGVQLLDIVGPLETFNLAAQQRIDDGEATQRAYVVDVIAKDATTGPSMSGLSMLATRTLDHPVDDIDTLIVPGALTGDRFFEDPDYVEFVRRASRKVRRTCSVCSGALLLAAAGLLDGRRATTHWMDAPTLKRVGAT
ncbi:MAG: DJ-1/PfpI family protein [Pseudomonadota bacterium]